MSEKANDLLNKFGSAQFDFMIWNTPDNLVARDKARQEISDYIAELEAGVAELKRQLEIAVEHEITAKVRSGNCETIVWKRG